VSFGAFSSSESKRHLPCSYVGVSLCVYVRGPLSLWVRVRVRWCGCAHVVLLLFRMFKITASSRMMRSQYRTRPHAWPSCVRLPLTRSTRRRAALVRGVRCASTHCCVRSDLTCFLRIQSWRGKTEDEGQADVVRIGTKTKSLIFSDWCRG
jgi:hypothetical protein